MKVRSRLVAPRWIKVWADIWENKLRTALVILSIAVGVFAVGMVYSAYLMFERDLAEAQKTRNQSALPAKR